METKTEKEWTIWVGPWYGNPRSVLNKVITKLGSAVAATPEEAARKLIKENRLIAAHFDEDTGRMRWTNSGLFPSKQDARGRTSRLFRQKNGR